MSTRETKFEEEILEDNWSDGSDYKV